MCIAKTAFNAIFRPSKHSFTPKTPFAEKVMGPNFKHLYDTSSAASRLVKTWDKEIIPVNTFDSLTLEGWFYTAGENARDTAILVHGYNSSPMGDMSAIMQFYLRRGINVLLTNNRGGKTSVGNNITFGLYERLDTALWVDKLNERFPDGSIILHGISLGGATVCLMSELDLKNVKCVVSDCAYTSIRAEFAHSSKLTMGFTPKATLERVYKLFAKSSAIPSTTSRLSGRCNTQNIRYCLFTARKTVLSLCEWRTNFTTPVPRTNACSLWTARDTARRMQTPRKSTNPP